MQFKAIIKNRRYLTCKTPKHKTMIKLPQQNRLNSIEIMFSVLRNKKHVLGSAFVKQKT